ncbi:MAG: NAD(P)/FAD-dependent oxidoreductase [Elusimicrobia bacterium]|nr:NAD(P)/FAD-dependent oxidoreductase [Candidatus Obscuribacterium magneticum]
MSLNLLIIGAGPAGEAAAKTAAQLGASVTLVEKEEAGGLCLNKGCVPSKALLEQVRKCLVMGIKPEWEALQQFKSGVVEGLRAQLEGSFKSLKIKLLKGTASFKDKSSLNVHTASGIESLPFDKAIIAAGTEVSLPPPLDQHQNQIWDSHKMLEINRTPASAAIIGGGAVGCEFACLLNAAGSKVTIIEMTGTLLPGEDPAITSSLGASFEKRGIQILTEKTVKDLQRKGALWHITLSNGETLTAEEILTCVGRAPKPELLAPEKGGIQYDKGSIKINNSLQTTNPNVFAAGDVTGLTRLAHAAAVQGKVAAVNALGGSETFDGSLVPRCLYSWPEVASVGRPKHDAEKETKTVKVSRGFFKGSAKALAAGEAEGFVQIVSDASGEKILGAQIIGPHATELIHIFSVALKKEMTLKELGEVIFAHPTLSEVIRDAAKR